MSTDVFTPPRAYAFLTHHPPPLPPLTTIKPIVIAATVEEGLVFFSRDYGVSWDEDISAEEGNWFGIDLSTNGTKGVACEYGGYVWTIGVPGASTERRAKLGGSFGW
jgi:hypothetical protein